MVMTEVWKEPVVHSTTTYDSKSDSWNGPENVLHSVRGTRTKTFSVPHHTFVFSLSEDGNVYEPMA